MSDSTVKTMADHSGSDAGDAEIDEQVEIAAPEPASKTTGKRDACNYHTPETEIDTSG